MDGAISAAGERSGLKERLGGPTGEQSRALVQKNVSRTFTRDVLHAFIAQSTHIDIAQQMLSGTE